MNQPIRTQQSSTVENHKYLKMWLIVSFIILALNVCILLLSLIPLAGVYIYIGTAPMLLIAGIVGLLNLFIISRALSRKYFVGKFNKIAKTVLVLSTLAVLGGMGSPFVLLVQYKENTNSQKIQDEVNKYYSEVTVDKAIELLNSCKIYKFNYSNSAGNDWERTPEDTNSGVLIYDMYSSLKNPSSSWDKAKGKYIMYIANSNESTLVPLARQAQKTCDIQFYHDDADEVKQQDGQWYFKGKPVES